MEPPMPGTPTSPMAYLKHCQWRLPIANDTAEWQLPQFVYWYVYRNMFIMNFANDKCQLLYIYIWGVINPHVQTHPNVSFETRIEGSTWKWGVGLRKMTTNEGYHQQRLGISLANIGRNWIHICRYITNLWISYIFIYPHISTYIMNIFHFPQEFLPRQAGQHGQQGFAVSAAFARQRGRYQCGSHGKVQSIGR